MSIEKFAQSNPNSPELKGSVLTVYHRTKAKDTAGGICNIGFMAGGGAAYGVGVYSTYWYSSSMKNYNLGYGPYVVKAEVDISGFLIFDYNMSKTMYGRNYKLIDQIKNIIGPDKIIDPSVNEERQWSQIRYWSQELEKTSWTSDVAMKMSRNYNLDRTGLNGIIYTGRHDGRCCVTYKSTLVIPIAHAIIHGGNYKNPIWEPCSQKSVEHLREMQNDEYKMEKFSDARKDLLKEFDRQKENRIFDMDYRQFPDIPEQVFDQMVTTYLWNNNSVINRLGPLLKRRLKDVIEIDFFLKRLRENPLVHWKEWEKQPKEVKDKVDPKNIVSIFEEYLETHKGHWDQLPDEIKKMIPKTSEANYWSKVVRGNPDNWKYVPQDIIDYMRETPKDFKLKTIPDQEDLEVARKDLEEAYKNAEEITVPMMSMGGVRNEIEKMNNRAAKLGLPPMRLIEVSEDRDARTVDIKVIGNIPTLQGYKLLAKLVALDDEEGNRSGKNEIQPLTDDKIPEHEDWESIDLRCDHCGYMKSGKTARRSAFLLEDTKDGSIKVIATSCLNLYIPGIEGTATGIAQYAQQFKDMIKKFSRTNEDEDPNKVRDNTMKQDRAQRRDFKKFGVPILFFLTRVSLIHRISSSYHYGTYGFGKKAWGMCVSQSNDRPDAISSEDISLALSVVQFAKDYKPSQNYRDEYDKRRKEDFAKKVNFIAGQGVVKKEYADIAAWMLNMKKKDVEDKKEYDKILGEKGSQVSFKGELLSKRPIYIGITQQGGSNVLQNYCIAKNNDGVMVAWADKFGINKDIGEEIVIKGVLSGYSLTNDNRTINNISDAEPINIEDFELDQTRMNSQVEEYRNKNKPALPPPASPPAGSTVSQTPASNQTVNQPIDYSDGNVVEANFTIERSKPMRGNTELYVLKDPNGVNVSTFTDRFLGNVGKVIRLKGTVKINKGFKNLVDIQVIQNNVQPPAPTPSAPSKVMPSPTSNSVVSYKDGDIVENDFKVKQKSKTSYGERTVLEDPNGKILSTFDNVPAPTGGQIRLKGTVKMKFSSKFRKTFTNLLNVQVVNQTPPASQQSSPSSLQTSSNPVPTSPASNQPAPVTSPNATPNNPTTVHSSSNKKYNISQSLQLMKKKDPEKEINEEDSEELSSIENTDIKKSTFKTYNEIDPDKTYEDFKKSYEKATGESQSRSWFDSRAKNWHFYGDEDGYITVLPQRSGLYKLTGVSGNEEKPLSKAKSIKKALDELLSTGKPIWGAVSGDIKSLLERNGFVSPPSFVLKQLIRYIPSSMFGGATIKSINDDGSFVLDYPGLKQNAVKYYVANKEYYNWLKQEIRNNERIPFLAKPLINKALTSIADNQDKFIKVACNIYSYNVESFVSIEDLI